MPSFSFSAGSVGIPSLPTASHRCGWLTISCLLALRFGTAIRLGGSHHRGPHGRRAKVVVRAAAVRPSGHRPRASGRRPRGSGGPSAVRTGAAAAGAAQVRQCPRNRSAAASRRWAQRMTR